MTPMVLFDSGARRDAYRLPAIVLAEFRIRKDLGMPTAQVIKERIATKCFSEIDTRSRINRRTIPLVNYMAVKLT